MTNPILTRRRAGASFLALSALLAAAPAFAQGGRPGGGNRLDFLAGYLSLTESQKTDAKAIFDAADQASDTLRGQMAGAHEALRAGIKAGKTESELDQLAAAVGSLEGQAVAIRAKAESKFYALLTADQKAKYDQLGQRGPGGPGGLGGFRGRR